MTENKLSLEYDKKPRWPALVWIGGCAAVAGLAMTMAAAWFSFTPPPVPQWVGLIGWISCVACLPVFAVGVILLSLGLSRREAAERNVEYGPTRGVRRAAVVWIVGLTILLALLCVFVPKLLAK